MNDATQALHWMGSESATNEAALFRARSWQMMLNTVPNVPDVPYQATRSNAKPRAMGHALDSFNIRRHRIE